MSNKVMFSHRLGLRLSMQPMLWASTAFVSMIDTLRVSCFSQPMVGLSWQ